MKRVSPALLGFVLFVILLSGGAAQSLSGSNTVTTDDIVDHNVTNPDLGTNAVTGDKIANGTITKADLAPSVHKAYFARIKDDGLAAGLIAGDATSAARVPSVNGEIKVHFPFDVSACAPTASVDVGPGSSSQFYAPYSFLIDHRATNGDVIVDIRNASNAPSYANFSLVVVCP